MGKWVLACLAALALLLGGAALGEPLRYESYCKMFAQEI